MKMSNYPEHEKLKAVREQSQAIGDFLDWVGDSKGWHLGYYPNGHETMWSVQYSIQNLLAEYFDIDLKALEKEKEQMLMAQEQILNVRPHSH